MLDRFKSAEKLEAELRAWTFAGHSDALSPEEIASWRQSVSEATTDCLVRKAVAACASFAEHAKFMQACGSPPSHDEIDYHTRGAEIIHALADKRGWEFSCDSPMNEFNVRISQKKG